MKMTKKTYYAKANAVSQKIEQVQAELQEMSRKCDAGEFELPLSDEICTKWNRLHDRKTDLEMDLEALHREYRTRNWTSYDWQQWNLVASNID